MVAMRFMPCRYCLFVFLVWFWKLSVLVPAVPLHIRVLFFWWEIYVAR